MQLPKFDMVKHAVAIGSGQVAGMVIAFLFLTLLARWMTKSDYGEIRYVISVATFAATVIAFGLPTTLTRYLAKYKDDDKKMGGYSTNVLVVFAITLVAIEVLVTILYWPRWIYPLVVLGYSLPVLYLAFVRGMMQYYKISFIEGGRSALKFVVLIVVLIVLGLTKTNVLLIYAFGGWLVLVALELVIPTVRKVKWGKVNAETMLEVMKFTMPVFFTTMAFAFLTVIPVLILERTWDFEVVAVYSTSFLVTFGMGIVPIVLNTIAMPKIAHMNKWSERNKLFCQCIIVILVCGVVLCGMTFLLGKWVLVLVFTSKYAASYTPMVILAVGSVFMGIKLAYASLWEGSGHPINSTIDGVSGAVIALVLCVLLVPTYGSTGAAIAYLGGWLACCVVDSILLVRLKLS